MEKAHNKMIAAYNNEEFLKCREEKKSAVQLVYKTINKHTGHVGGNGSGGTNMRKVDQRTYTGSLQQCRMMPLDSGVFLNKETLAKQKHLTLSPMCICTM